MNEYNQGVKDIESEAQTRVISFTSGKGGVGKTTSVLNIAIALQQQGKKVLLLDADLGLANINVLLGNKPSKTLEHFFEGGAELEEIFIEGPHGLIVIPAASGVEQMASLNNERKLQLMLALEETPYSFDYLLIDTQAGIGQDVFYFNTAADETVCVITPEPTSLTDAFALIKIMARNYREKEISILVNQVANKKEADKIYDRLQVACEQYLQIKTNYFGFVPKDKYVVHAIKKQEPVLHSYPRANATKALRTIADSLAQDFHERKMKGGMQFYFKKLLEVGADG